MKKSFLILFLFAIGLFTKLNAQTDTIIDGKHYQLVEKKDSVAKDPKQAKTNLKPKKHVPPMDSTFVLNNKKLKYYNDWLSAGAGIQQNLTYRRKYGFAGGVDFNFHIKQYYFQLGTILSGERFGSYDSYQGHVGYGKRWEDKDFNAAVFGGISYSTGYAKVDTSGKYERPFKRPGIYVEGQIVKKLTYDVGIGVSIFADYNQEQGIAGAKLIIYFSGAYQGKVASQQRVQNKRRK